MTYWIDQKFLSLLSSQLPLYKVTSSNPFKASCRCPICGDSQKNQYKKRGHFYKHKELILFKCFNCGATRSIKSLLKDMNPELKKEYDLEIFAETRPVGDVEVIKTINHEYLSPDEYNKPLRGLKKISQLHVGHPAKVYIESRSIPPAAHFRLYYCAKFFAWTNSIIPDKFKLEKGDEPRLVIPFFDKDGNMFGYQGRSFDPKSDLRYITIMTRGDFTKVYGLDQWAADQQTFVVEGPLDSLFLPNCLAMAGSDLDLKFLNPEKTTIVFDNEPRSKEIVSKIISSIDKGFSVCLWPDYIQQKDINDMVLSGLNPAKVVDIIKGNTYNGLEAKLKMSTWSKV